MAPFDLVIFDCDGVLVDSEMLSCGCLAETFKAYGLPIEIEDVLQSCLGRSLADVGDYYRDRTGRTVPADFGNVLRTRILTAFAENLSEIPDVRGVLDAIRPATCLASSSDRERVTFALQKVGLSSYFDGHVFTSELVQRGKPQPDLFLLAAERMKVDPHRVLVIEDSASGVAAGKAAGMTVWGFIGGSHYARRDGHSMLSQAGADRIFARMSDIGLALAG